MTRGQPGGCDRRRSSVVVPFLTLIAFAVLASGCTKMTGGGWIQSSSLEDGERATFGFTARCRTVTALGAPAALLHDGQFEFHDQGVGVDVHGDVVPNEFRTVPGMTCKQLAANDPNLLHIGGFEGTYRTQSGVDSPPAGEFAVVVADGAETDTADEICVSLAGLIIYDHCGVVEGGNIKVEE